MAFEWDPKKNISNVYKHGISFEEAKEIFNGPVFTIKDDRKDYGESRFVSIGALGPAVVIVVVHADRRGQIRIVSARKANKSERRKYYEYLEEKT